jgi:hypothetical protein
MFEFVLDLASPKRRVHVYGDGSCGNDTEETRCGLGSSAQQYGHAIPGFNPRLRQCLGDRH